MSEEVTQPAEGNIDTASTPDAEQTITSSIKPTHSSHTSRSLEADSAVQSGQGSINYTTTDYFPSESDHGHRSHSIYGPNRRVYSEPWGKRGLSIEQGRSSSLALADATASEPGKVSTPCR